MQSAASQVLCDPVPVYSKQDVFFCPEESHFYSYCLERLVFNRYSDADSIIEFGCGDGSPVINALMRSCFGGTIQGYELNPDAYQVACSRIAHLELDETYSVHNRSFFEADIPNAQCLIANPPYLPAPDNNICMPLLHGGSDGATITNRLLTLDCPNVMLLVSSYSNPVETIEHGLDQGYAIADFMLTPLPFGYYSSEPKVRNSIAKLRQNQQAFYSQNIYFLAGVLFTKQELCTTDLSNELIKVMTAL
ncbi:SAM-dependent methyltransferase [Myxacorys almedinensis A]|uniref:SAM-dependent methyltransferase n=2 Tax=Myxacorys TaxID=2056239 RepID=A0A8J7Z3T1_9CYAN|nr:SAM-dependent methyltransferase [Myxacorys almedinensis A]